MRCRLEAAILFHPLFLTNFKTENIYILNQFNLQFEFFLTTPLRDLSKVIKITHCIIDSAYGL